MAAAVISNVTASFHNASAPDTQATAPVLEFRCTYTREGYKKQPKFHDGFISYHTFNRVIVLYDDTRRVVTNHHYRDDEEVEEGARLTFDRSILVDVAEPAGRTQTDLNQVLIQRNPPEARPAAAPRLPRVAAASQGRPRSLRDVLGASQGPIGRARLPSQTPYEQRQIEVSSHSEQPPAKRLKTTTGKEYVPSSDKSSPQPQKQRSPPAKRPVPAQLKAPRTTWAPASTQAVVGQVHEVHELSSDPEEDEDAAAVTFFSRQLPRGHKQKTAAQRRAVVEDLVGDLAMNSINRSPPRKNPRHAVKQPAKLTAPKDKPPAAEKTAERVKSAVKKTEVHTGLNTEPRAASGQSSRATPRVYTPTPGTSQLQLSKERPRRKLMYRALLPTFKPAVNESSTGAGAMGNILSSLDSENRALPRRKEHLDSPEVEHARSLNDIAAPTHQRPESQDIDAAKGPPTPEPDHEPIAIDSSPLFMSQPEPSPPSPSQHLEDSQDFDVHMLEVTKPTQRGDTSDFPIPLSPEPECPQSPQRKKGGPFFDEYGDEDEDEVDGQSSLPKQTTSQQRMPPPPRPTALPTAATPGTTPSIPPSPARSASSKQPFRRVLSENDALQADTASDLTSDPFPSLLPDADFPPTAALLHRRSPPKLPRNNMMMPPPRQPSILRRTLSDPINVQPVNSDAATRSHMTSFNVQPLSEEPKGEGATGPWTFTEAWLLFDVERWPDAKKKGMVPEWTKGISGEDGGGGVVTAGSGRGAAGGAGGGLGAGNSSSGFSSAKGLWIGMREGEERTAQGRGGLRDEC